MSSPQPLHRALVLAGHDVDWRPILPGEDLSAYDLMIIGLISPWMGTARGFLSALWAIGQSNPKLLLLDDWQISGLGTNLRWFLKNPDRVWGAASRFHHRDVAAPHREMLDDVHRYLANETWREPVLAGLWDGGDLALLKRGTQIGELIPFDPTPLAHNYGMRAASPDEKQRRWVLGALTNQTAWANRLGLAWPLDMYGKKRLGQPKLSEHDLVERYAAAWGVLAPQYYHSGSGWWRARFVHAVQTGCVLLASEADAAIFGNAYLRVARHPRLVETARTDELAVICGEQKDAFERRAWSLQRLIDTIDVAVRRSTSR